MFIIYHRKLFYIISIIFVSTAIISLFVFGLKPGIDFTGGSIVEVEFLKERPAVEDVKKKLDSYGFTGSVIQPSDERGLILRMKEIPEEKRQDLSRAIAGGKDPSTVFVEKRLDSIGPAIGLELRRKALIAIVLVISLILIFITWVFRKVSRPVASWKYGIVAILALIHDIIIPTGLFAILGRFFGAEIDSLFVTALLTILGFSIHDTIVVFDRIRENLRKSSGENFEPIVAKSVSETFGRSLSTSFAIFIVLAALFWFGAEVTRYFALTLLVGVVAGTYSSICLASPFLVTWHKLTNRR